MTTEYSKALNKVRAIESWIDDQINAGVRTGTCPEHVLRFSLEDEYTYDPEGTLGRVIAKLDRNGELDELFVPNPSAPGYIRYREIS